MVQAMHLRAYMSLDEKAILVLRKAVGDYSFPTHSFDFAARRIISHANMRELESAISGSLLSNNMESVRSSGF